jgi:hypothetical protein
MRTIVPVLLGVSLFALPAAAQTQSDWPYVKTDTSLAQRLHDMYGISPWTTEELLKGAQPVPAPRATFPAPEAPSPGLAPKTPLLYRSPLEMPNPSPSMPASGVRLGPEWRLPTEKEAAALAGGSYLTFRASNTMTLADMTAQMTANGLSTSAAERMAPSALRLLKSIPVKSISAVVAIGATAIVVYDHFVAPVDTR